MKPEKDAQGRWLYGDAGDRYPVQEGEIWRVGPHILACGDIEKGHAQQLLQQFPRVDLAICDPPWNAGNARSFRTKAGDGRPVDFPAFLSTILSLGPRTKSPWFLEMGSQHASLVESLVEQHKGCLIDSWHIRYYRKHPCVLLHFSWGNIAATPDLAGIAGLDDIEAFAFAIAASSQPGDVVFDVCMGRGLTACVAHDQGKKALGLELHPRRLAVTIDLLVQRTHALPEKVGMLY